MITPETQYFVMIFLNHNLGETIVLMDLLSVQRANTLQMIRFPKSHLAPSKMQPWSTCARQEPPRAAGRHAAPDPTATLVRERGGSSDHARTRTTRTGACGTGPNGR